jgi:hypothetical protein
MLDFQRHAMRLSELGQRYNEIGLRYYATWKCLRYPKCPIEDASSVKREYTLKNAADLTDSRLIRVHVNAS